ncbi:MAG: FadR/GntR family transcriptional regulator [Pseudonocardiaceae bacterium]
MVEVRRGRGWFVRRKPADYLPTDFMDWLSERRFRIGERLEVRMALEGMAASLAAARATEGEIDDIAKLSKDHLAAFPDVDELIRTDEAFHDAIFRASRNELLLATYRMLIPELTEWRRRGFTGRAVAARSGTEHDNVVNFLKRGDSAGARAAMMTHLLAGYHEIQETDEQDGPERSAHLTTFVGIEDEPEWHDR